MGRGQKDATLSGSPCTAVLQLSGVQALRSVTRLSAKSLVLSPVFEKFLARMSGAHG